MQYTPNYNLKLPEGKEKISNSDINYNARVLDEKVKEANDKVDNYEYSLPTASSSILGGIKVGNNLTISNGVLSGTPNTTYNVATNTANGLMSATDKVKLGGIENNANKYTLPTASSSVLGGIKVGNNLTINNGILSGTPNTTYNVATTSTDGLMKSSDKLKLDGIETNANNYTHPDTHPASQITGLSAVATSGSYNDLSNKPIIPSKVSQLTNDSGYLTAHQDISGKADKTELTAHNSSNTSHSDIRNLIAGLTTRLNSLADSDDTTLDQMSEIVTYIKNNKTLIENVTTNKINVSDIINNLTTNVNNKPLSASQGVVLKGLIDAIVIPTKTSDITNDSHFAVDANYVHTDNNYTTTEKNKLSGIATGANNYSLPTATSSVLGGIKTGSNLTNTSGVLSLTKTNVTTALGYTPPTTNTTYADATTSTHGLMSTTDKSKLNGIATGANNYSLPTASATVLGGIKVGANLTIENGVLSADGCAIPQSDTAPTDGSALWIQTNVSDDSSGDSYHLPQAGTETLGGIKMTSSTVDLTDGVSALETNALYFVHK